MRVLRRRRAQAKTDYRARIQLLKSSKPRLVIRKTNRYIIGQLISSFHAQDKVIATVTTKELIKEGWPKDKSGSLKSLVAAYLGGKLLASKIKKDNNEAIVDFGLNRNIQKSRIYAFVKGMIDSGINIPCGEEALPSEEQISSNETLKDIFTKLNKKL
jgi:large subunit ribosomal protein L18